MYRVPKYLLDIVLMSVFILHTTFLNWWETTFIYLLIHRMICIRVTLSLSHGGWHPKKERKKDPRGLRLSVLHAKRVSVLLCHFISFHPQTARGDRHVTSPGPRTKSCTFLQWSTNPILAWESGYIYIYIYMYIKVTTCAWYVWWFSPPVCWIMYGYYRELYSVKH